MKVATAYYTGPQRSHNRRGPSGQQYHFSKGAKGAPDVPAEVDSVKDALYLDERGVFDVEWTAIGQVVRLSKSLESPADEIEAMLSDMGYRQKQKLASNLGLKAGGKEDELDERLRPEVERLQAQMEEH